MSVCHTQGHAQLYTVRTSPRPLPGLEACLTDDGGRCRRAEFRQRMPKAGWPTSLSRIQAGVREKRRCKTTLLKLSFPCTSADLYASSMHVHSFQQCSPVLHEERTLAVSQSVREFPSLDWDSRPSIRGLSMADIPTEASSEIEKLEFALHSADTWPKHEVPPYCRTSLHKLLLCISQRYAN